MRVLVCALAMCGCARAPLNEPEVLSRLEREQVADRMAKGDVRLGCPVKDAEVYVDGVLQGVCDDFDGEPAFLTVGAGAHRIEVRKLGLRSWHADVVTGDAVVVLNVELPPN